MRRNWKVSKEVIKVDKSSENHRRAWCGKKEKSRFKIGGGTIVWDTDFASFSFLRFLSDNSTAADEIQVQFFKDNFIKIYQHILMIPVVGDFCRENIDS
jgi:hypothetical protein